MLFDPFIYHGMAETHDRDRDMRLDVDNMSYEESLALEERIGDVNTGPNEETILNLMKQQKYSSTTTKSNTNSHLNSTSPEAINEEGHVLPCIEHFQKLEKAFKELSNKPTGIYKWTNRQRIEPIV